MATQSGLVWPIWFAALDAFAMIVAGISVVFFHERKFAEIEQLVDYSFSSHVPNRVVLYFRGFGVLMAIFFLLFTLALFTLQHSAGMKLFEEGRATVFGMMLFAFDLVARGAFFDWMEHFNWRLTPLHMNREAHWFVLYAFVFRMFYALTLLRMLISFAWIYRKLRLAKKDHSEPEATG